MYIVFFLSSWFFGKMDRPDAEKKLLVPGLPMGCYLIRKSHNFPEDFTLSIRIRHDNVWHYRIQAVKSGKVETAFFIGTDTRFPSLSSLVRYYSNNADGLCCKLTHPCGMAKPVVTVAQELSNRLGAGQEQDDKDSYEHCYDEGNICCHAS